MIMHPVSVAPLDFDTVRLAAGFEESADVLRHHWHCSVNWIVLDDPLASPAALARWCDWADLGPQITADLVRALPQLQASPPLLRLLNHYHWLIFEDGDLPSIPWPHLSDRCGDLRHLFHPLLYVAALPRMKAIHEQRHIDPAVTRATIADLALWLRESHRRHGHWGLPHAYWMSFHVAGRLIALGRLQYELRTFSFPFRAFRHRHSRQVITLANGGGRFRPDGQFESAHATPPDCPVWVAHYQERDGQIIGHPLAPRGHVLPQPVSLPTSDWELALQPGDPILSVHIPASGPMDHDACGQSFRQALDFFPRHFPEHRFRAFACGSWLMDSQLADHLPPTSNLVRFLKRYHLLPLERASAGAIYERVFGEWSPDFSRVPQDTQLRRAVVRHVQSGGHWRTAAGFLLPHETSLESVW